MKLEKLEEFLKPTQEELFLGSLDSLGIIEMVGNMVETPTLGGIKTGRGFLEFTFTLVDSFQGKMGKKRGH